MPRQVPRHNTLRQLDTAVIQNWLADARRRGYTDAVLTLELELCARHVFDDAAPERAFPLSYIADDARRSAIARTRLQNAADRQSIDAFHQNLGYFDMDNVAHAWQQARRFEDVANRSAALVHVAYCITVYFKGPEEAGDFVGGVTGNKSPEATIAALEEQFGKLIDQAAEVQNA